MKRKTGVPTNARPTPLAARPKKPVSSEDEVRSAPFLKRPLVLARKGITSGSSLSSLSSSSDEEDAAAPPAAADAAFFCCCCA